MNRQHRYGALPALLVAGMGWSMLTGCAETSIVGSVLDEQISGGNLDIMIALTRGSNSEVTDVWSVGFAGYWEENSSATDAWLNDGAATVEQQNEIGDWDPAVLNVPWEQGMEGSWSGLKLVNNLIESPVDETTTVLTARGYANSAHSERLLGDVFCELAYGFNHLGGQDLSNLGDATFPAEPGPVPKDSAFKRMLTFAELALEAADRAIAAGTGSPVNEGLPSDSLFDPEMVRFEALGLIAQAHHALAALGVDPAQNWSAAVDAASQVPIDYTKSDHVSEDVEQNELWDALFDNDDFTVWSEENPEAPFGFDGVPATFLWPDDPRVAFLDCTTDPGGACDDGFTNFTEQDKPIWGPVKYDHAGADVPMVKGTMMRLIEAEEALVNRQDFTTFYDLVDEVRAFYGVAPTERPMVMGDFEWPNAEDDALSILDRERYLTGWLEGRRLFDLHRWNHPFITENVGLSPETRELLEGRQRRSCYFLPESECSLNTVLAASDGCLG